MSHIKAVKQRVCLAIFTVGLSLAAFHEIGCAPEQNNMANITIKQIEHIVLFRS